MEFEEDNIAITIQKYQNVFVYFLIKDNIVVYVGQTKRGLSRPLSHTNKEFDVIKIIYCNEEQLDILEDKYIIKYKPKYNKTLNNVINYSLKRTKNKIRELYDYKIPIPTLKKIINKLNIEIYAINGISYIKQCDFIKIIDYLKKEIQNKNE